MDGDRASPYLDPYRAAVEEMGVGFEAQLWVSRTAQSKRFAVIRRALAESPGVVADLGCGQADLLLDLHDHNALPERYLGIEGVGAMTEHARSRAEARGIEAAEFLTHDFVADGDLPGQLVRDAGTRVFVFSGSLNTLPMADAQRVLARFWDALAGAGRGTMVFNFLSERHDAARTPARPPAVRFDPVSMLAWALDRTPAVRLEHDYLLGHDATVVMRVPDPNA